MRKIMRKSAKRLIIFLAILFVAAVSGYRIQAILKESARTVNNISRIQTERGIPKDYVVLKKTTDYLREPLYIQNGRALVSANRVHRFKVGQKIEGTNAIIKSITSRIDLDTGMFIVSISKKISGRFMVLGKYTGFFVTLDAELPSHARVIARDGERMVITNLKAGDKVSVR